MQISIPLDNWDPERGGTERYIQLLARSLHERGHEVTVICLKTHTTAASTPRVQVVRGSAGPRWLRELQFSRRSVAAHRASGRDLLLAVRHALAADVYHPHGGSFRAGRKAAARSFPPLWRGCRAALASLRPTVHVLRWLDRAVFVRSAQMTTISVSQKVEDDLKHTYPGINFSFARLENTADTQTYHGVDRPAVRAAWDARFGFTPETPRACFVGHNFRLKGLSHAMNALVRAEKWHLLVAGGGAPTPYRREAERLGLSQRVHFLGRLRSPRELYVASDAILAPTYYDTCSLNVLEALACGTPAITTQQNGADAIVVRHKAGRVVPYPGDTSALAAALEAIRLDPERFLAGAHRARETFSWPQHVDSMVAILEQALARRRGDVSG